MGPHVGLLEIMPCILLGYYKTFLTNNSYTLFYRFFWVGRRKTARLTKSSLLDNLITFTFVLPHMSLYPEMFLHKWQKNCFANTLSAIRFSFKLILGSCVLKLWGVLEFYITKMYMVQNKVNTQTPCFVVEMFLVDGALDTTFKVPIFMKIYMCKIQE